jgi:hypothetical protein
VSLNHDRPRLSFRQVDKFLRQPQIDDLIVNCNAPTRTSIVLLLPARMRRLDSSRR